MNKIKISIAGESHGRGLIGIIDGVPANLKLDIKQINKELQRRQLGFGRGKRMQIEKDKVDILAGIRNNITMGGQIALYIQNKDYENWISVMNGEKDNRGELTAPRPNHSDFSGKIKYGLTDIRDVIEIASARRTAIYTALGSVAKLFLKEFGIYFFSHTVQIGQIIVPYDERNFLVENIDNDIQIRIDQNPLRCYNDEIERDMLEIVHKAQENKDSVGGSAQLIIKNVPIGLGSYKSIEERLDSQLTSYLMGIPSVKGVTIGGGINLTIKSGSEIIDELGVVDNKITHLSNNMGGIDGGISNGNTIYLTIFAKPIPTLPREVRTIDLSDKKEAITFKERADTCVVPAIGVIAESLAALVIMNAFLSKFGGDDMGSVKSNYNTYIKKVDELLQIKNVN